VLPVHVQVWKQVLTNNCIIIIIINISFHINPSRRKACELHNRGVLRRPIAKAIHSQPFSSN
ncbi:hypothetical protein RDWZM_009170, partial [Blomia tropicalis]